MAGSTEPAGRHFFVVRGNPDEAEIAALAAAIAAVSAARAVQSAAHPAASRPHSRWADRARLLREPIRQGPGWWRASALPR